MLEGRGTILALGRGGRTGAAELKRPDVTEDGGEISGGAESEGGDGAGVTGGGGFAATGTEGGAAAATGTAGGGAAATGGGAGDALTRMETGGGGGVCDARTGGGGGVRDARTGGGGGVCETRVGGASSTSSRSASASTSASSLGSLVIVRPRVTFRKRTIPQGGRRKNHWSRGHGRWLPDGLQVTLRAHENRRTGHRFELVPPDRGAGEPERADGDSRPRQGDGPLRRDPPRRE